MSVKVVLGDDQKAEIITNLERENNKLKAKIRRLESKLEKIDGYMDITKERRALISEICEKLVLQLQDIHWIDVDEYGNLSTPAGAGR